MRPALAETPQAHAMSYLTLRQTENHTHLINSRNNVARAPRHVASTFVFPDSPILAH